MLAASSLCEVGGSDSVSWAQRSDVMVVGSRPRAGGEKASLEPLLSHRPEYDFLPFRPSLSFLFFPSFLQRLETT